MGQSRILVVEDKFIVAQDIATSLKKLGYDVCKILDSGEEVVAQARELQPDLVLMDIRLKGSIDGIEAAKELKSQFDIPVVYLTAHSDEETVQRAGETEPCGYLLKPFDQRQLYITVELALNRRRELKDRKHIAVEKFVPRQSIKSEKAKEITSKESRREELSKIIGSHEKMTKLLHDLELVARTDVGVHIFGENGTGKELIADALHTLSPRSSKPFIKLNCSAIPTQLLESALFGHAKGAFTGAHKDQIGFIERASGGTLFLDEIGDVSHDIQVKLLRVLQSREYNKVGETSVTKADIRLVTATNRDLKALMADGKIREDFYYRIHVFPLTVPPLRERGDDVLEIADYFRQISNRSFGKDVQGFSEEAKAALLAHTWPGNVRELENTIRRAFVLVEGSTITVDHLPQELVVNSVKPITASSIPSFPDKVEIQA